MARILVGISLTLAATVGCFVAAPPSPLSASALSKPVNLGLYHNGWDSYFRSHFGAAPTDSTLQLRLQTSAAVTSTGVYFNNRSVAAQFPMRLERRGPKRSVWSVKLTMPAKPGILEYYFGVKAGKVVEWYGDNGSMSGGGPGQPYARQITVVPYELTVYLKQFQVPSWMNRAIVYQVFPDRFFNGDRKNDPQTGTRRGYITVYLHKKWSETPWDGPVYSSDFYGGDLQGVIDKLGYIHSLGVTVLYLNPIFRAPSDHKYDTSDYFAIDSDFGKMSTFKTLVADARKLGIHLLLDGVFNHTGSDSVYFNEYGTFKDVGAYQSRSSKYYPWYTFTQWPDSYDSFAGVSSLPTLREILPVENFIFRKPGSVAQYWLDQGSSGWRLDYALGKSHTWWQAFRQSVKKSHPNAALIGEVFSPLNSPNLANPTPYLLGNEFDGATNYRFRDAILNFFAGGNGANTPSPLNASQFLTAQMGLLQEVPRPAELASMNIVDTHDTQRILTSLNGDKRALRLVALYQMTWLGAPTIFYGDETGILGSDNNTGRATFPWDHQDGGLESYYKSLISLRRTYAALTDGSVQPLLASSSQRAVAYLSQSGKQQIVVAVNDSNNAQTLTIPVPQLANGSVLHDLLKAAPAIRVPSGKIKLDVPRLSGAVLLVAKK